MDAQQIKLVLLANKAKLFITYPLTSLALFGSYADGTATPDSDVDIMAEFSEPVGFEFVDLAIELEEIRHKKVDLTTVKALKPALWKFVRPQLQYV